MSASTEIDRALSDLAAGRPILVYDADGREEETDLLVAAHRVVPEHVALLRRDGGGLVFLALGHRAAEAAGLPFAQDLIEAGADRWPLLGDLAASDLPYDSRSSFSLWLNHRDTYTGITDRDRALTISRLGAYAGRAASYRNGEARQALAREFRTPGHVPVCVADAEPLVGRKGHTELAVALARMAGVPEAVAGCEMMDDTTHRALSRSDAIKYAARNDLVFLTGSEVTEAYRAWRAAKPQGKRRATAAAGTRSA